MSRAATTSKPNVKMIALKDLIPTKDNPRFIPHDGALRDLAASIKENGLLQPVLARPHPTKKGKYDLRLGHRRLLASKQAGLTEIPVIIRELSDRAAMETTITENLQREDLHPLEECIGIRKLLDSDPKIDIEEVAAKLGKSQQWIARRARLTSLIEPIRKSVMKADSEWGRVSVGVLERVARLPDALQKMVREDGWHDEPPGYCGTIKDFDSYMNREVLMALKSAPWKLDDEDLLSKAGSCLQCSKRTNCQSLLFDDDQHADRRAKLGDRCLDPACFNAKGERAIRAKIEKARAEHGDAILLNANYGNEKKLQESYGDLGVGIVASCNVREVQKGVPGAKPAVVISGAGLGQTRWVKPYSQVRSGSSRPRDADGKVKPLSLKERRNQLDRRRHRWFVGQVRDRLSELRETEMGFPEIKPMNEHPSMLGCVLAAFGTNHTEDAYFPAGQPASWAEFRFVQSLKPDELEMRLWKSVFGVWIERLRDQGLAAIRAQAADAKLMCPFLGLDVEVLRGQAVEAIPEPKSWSNLKADGTPKSKSAKPKRSQPHEKDSLEDAKQSETTRSPACRTQRKEAPA